jgi:TonB family protein
MRAAVAPSAVDGAIAPAPGQPFAHSPSGERILPTATEYDRTFLFALLIVLFLHVLALAASIQLGIGNPPALRKGQVENTQTVTVELVEAPDPRSQLKVSQDGSDAPPAPQAEEAEAAKPVEAQDERAEVRPVREQPKVADAAKDPPKQEPISLEGIDVTLNDYVAAVDAQMAQQRQKRQKAKSAADRARVLGAAPEGEQSPYAKSVIAELAKNKPPVAISQGEVLIGFELNPTGTLKFVKVLMSSNDKYLDEMALNAVKRTKFPIAPPGANWEDLTYQISYVFR